MKKLLNCECVKLSNSFNITCVNPHCEIGARNQANLLTTIQASLDPAHPVNWPPVRYFHRQTSRPMGMQGKRGG